MNIGLVGLIGLILFTSLNSIKIQACYKLVNNQIHSYKLTTVTGEEGFSVLVDFSSSLFPIVSSKSTTKSNNV